MSKQTDYSFIRYANCWEDTNILLDALDIKEHEIGLSVASGGDNTLAMLVKNPDKIYAFDLNKTQLYTLELKMATIKNLNRAEALKFLGVLDCKNRQRLYSKVERSLSDAARAYFKINSDIIASGVIHAGKFERFLSTFRRVIVPLVCKTEDFQDFAMMDDPAKQAKFYTEKIATRRYYALFKIFFGAKVMGKLGRDKNFYKYVARKKEQGTDLLDRVEFGISHSPNRNNPYLNYIAYGYFNEDSLPFYLQRDNYYKIRENLDRIELVHGDLMQVDDKNYDFINLSDIFEYMSAADFRKNVRRIEQITDKKARIAYWNQQNERILRSKYFTYLEKKSAELFARNQSWFYRDFRVYKKH